MNAKLLGAVTAAALLGSIGVASAQEPIQLTDVQLDAVTSGTTAALAIAIVDGALVNPVIALSAPPGVGPEQTTNPNARVATGFTPLAPTATLAIAVMVAGVETP
jgi:hypothetical protein